MSGCVDHILRGIVDPNCPISKFCHGQDGWNIDGIKVRVIVGVRKPRLVDGGVGDPDAVRALAVAGNKRVGIYTKNIPLRRFG